MVWEDAFFREYLKNLRKDKACNRMRPSMLRIMKLTLKILRQIKTQALQMRKEVK